MNSKQRRKARRAKGTSNDFFGDLKKQPVLFGLDRTGPDVVRQLGAHAKIVTVEHGLTVEEAIKEGIEIGRRPLGDGWPLEGR